MVLLFGKYGTIAIGIGDQGIIAVGFHFGWGITFKVDGNKTAFVPEALAHHGGICQQPKGIGGLCKELDALGVPCSAEGKCENLLRAAKLAQLFFEVLDVCFHGNRFELNKKENEGMP